jgi:hypothetical protein
MHDPCRLVRLVRQVKQFVRRPAVKLLHLPDEPAGVGEKEPKPL